MTCTTCSHVTHFFLLVLYCNHVTLLLWTHDLYCCNHVTLLLWTYDLYFCNHVTDQLCPACSHVTDLFRFLPEHQVHVLLAPAPLLLLAPEELHVLQQARQVEIVVAHSLGEDIRLLCREGAGINDK